jgi:hypothetical protein
LNRFSGLSTGAQQYQWFLSFRDLSPADENLTPASHVSSMQSQPGLDLMAAPEHGLHGRRGGPFASSNPDEDQKTPSKDPGAQPCPAPATLSRSNIPLPQFEEFDRGK